MYKAGSKTRRSMNRPILDKENMSEALNNQPRDRPNSSIQNLLAGHSRMSIEEKPFKKLLQRGLEQENSHEPRDFLVPSRDSSSSSTPGINELENARLLRDYSTDFLNNMLRSTRDASRFLERHEVTGQLRAKMIDWMVEVFSSYKFLDGSFFRGVEIMDRFFQLSVKPQETKDLHLIGVTSIFMASKLEEIYPLKLRTVHEKIAHRKLNPDVIRQKEAEVLELFGFSIVGNTLYDPIALCLQLVNQDVRLSIKQFQQLEQLCVYLAKAASYDYVLLSEWDRLVVASSILLLGFKMFEQLHKEFSAEQTIHRVYSLLGVTLQHVNSCSSHLLKLVKNFDRQYPNLTNLKKFGKLNLDGQRYGLPL